jgi:hypothetical protein
MKRIRGNESSYVAIFILNEQNTMFFFLTFIFFLLQNWRTGGWNRSVEGVRAWHQWDWGSGGERE